MHAWKMWLLCLTWAIPAGWASAQPQEFRPVKLGTPSAVKPTVTLGRPGVALGRPQVRAEAPKQEYFLDWARPIFRGQMAEPPPIAIQPPPPFVDPLRGPQPLPFPGGAGLPVAPAGRQKQSRAVGEEYLCARPNDDADMGGFFARSGQKLRHCWEDVSDGFMGVFSGRNAFESDHRHCEMISPVTNPYYFEDPRALTELRPVFIWQKTRSSNGVFAGGSNYFIDLQGRVAFTENISLVVNRLGYTWANPKNGNAELPGGSGFSEVHLGPKFSFDLFQRSVAAIGANFEMGVGNRDVGQNTGNLSISPYFSFATPFGDAFMPAGYGLFNFMNTTGYSLGIDSKRTDFFYTSLHVDYDFLGGKKFYPLIELNYTRYVFNGSERTLGFEGSNLFNFGSDGVAGHGDLTLAAGARYKFSEAFQVGAAGEFGLLTNPRNLEGFRLTIDVIFRY